LILIDLGGMAGAGTSDVALYNGGFFLRGTNGALGVGTQTWGTMINGGTSFDTTRRNHVLYETPAIAGFTVQAAVAEDNFWDVALRYAGEFSGFRLAFGIGYLNDTEFATSIESEEIKGSASLLHVASGLFVTAAGGKREVSGALSFDANYWYVAAGVRKNYLGFGDTVLFGEYSQHNDFFEDGSEATHWGVGINQYIDAAAMEVFLVYKSFEASSPGLVALEDFQTIIGGARVNF
jgi:hypothetical protein